MKNFYRELNDFQLNRLSEIAGNLGLVFVASVILPILLGDKEPNLMNMTGGLILTVLSWLASMWLLKKKRK